MHIYAVHLADSTDDDDSEVQVKNNVALDLISPELDRLIAN